MIKGAHFVVTSDRAGETPVSITLAEPGEDRELKAISYIASILSDFSDEQRRRILNYLCERFPMIVIEGRLQD